MKETYTVHEMYLTISESELSFPSVSTIIYLKCKTSANTNPKKTL